MMLEQGLSISSLSASRPADPGPRIGFSPALASGFQPAFRHRRSGEVRLSQVSDGCIASFHALDCLPSHWILERDHDGRPSVLVSDVDAGYLRGHEFWTLRDLVNPRLDA